MQEIAKDLGLLIMRVSIGLLMLLGHGWEKLFNFKEKLQVFPDPIGLGTEFALASAVGVEFFCQLLILTGIKTRLASIPSLFTMLVAAFVVHANDPWSVKERAILFACFYLTLAITGGGKFSVKE